MCSQLLGSLHGRWDNGVTSAAHGVGVEELGVRGESERCHRQHLAVLRPGALRSQSVRLVLPIPRVWYSLHAETQSMD